MFVQVIHGQVSNAGEVRAALDRWTQELAPEAVGWLGTTAGVTADDRFVAVVRFDSENAARINSQRPEQDQWWSQTSQLFTGDVTFEESTEVDVDLQGDPNTAGFVQVIQGRTNDSDRARELMTQNPDRWAAFRPDIIASVGAEHAGGHNTAVLYFTSEEEAREGERKTPPPELKEQMDEMGTLEVGEPTFLDLKEPWLYSPR
ncbi:MAG TPA: hypothetical protein VFJ14_08795 [Nocardioidaceae bacterium]|nr:hypothetical protein [Nocardioidaceae bacterium]